MSALDIAGRAVSAKIADVSSSGGGMIEVEELGSEGNLVFFFVCLDTLSDFGDPRVDPAALLRRLTARLALLVEASEV